MKWKRTKAKGNQLSFWKRIRFKYKLSFINESTLEEVWMVRLSQLSVFIAFALFAFSVVAFTAFLIIKYRTYTSGTLQRFCRVKYGWIRFGKSIPWHG